MNRRSEGGEEGEEGEGRKGKSFAHFTKILWLAKVKWVKMKVKKVKVRGEDKRVKAYFSVQRTRWKQSSLRKKSFSQSGWSGPLSESQVISSSMVVLQVDHVFFSCSHTPFWLDMTHHVSFLEGIYHWDAKCSMWKFKGERAGVVHWVISLQLVSS